MMYKIINNEIGIPGDRHLTPVTRHSSHNNSKSFIPHQTRPQSHKHSHVSLELYQSGTNYLKQAFKLQVLKSSKQLYNYNNLHKPHISLA